MLVRSLFAIATLSVLLASPLVGAHSGATEVLGLPPGFSVGDGTGTPIEYANGGSENYPPDIMGDQAGYALKFRCPNYVKPPPAPVPIPQPEPRCPRDVIDEEDIMSQPILLSDPKDPDLFAFNAMHGARGIDQGPTNISRNNVLHQPHTTWYTPNGHDAWSWTDNPYYSPLQPPKNKQNIESPVDFLGIQVAGRQVFGTDNAATLDAQGRVYLASLYAYRDTFGAGEWNYAFGFWKSQYRVKAPVAYTEGSVIRKLPLGAEAETPTMVYVPGTDRVATLWLERNDTAAIKSYINLTWTIPGKGGIWYPMKFSQRIGPCSAMTNAIAYHGIIYVGCFADKGFSQANVTIGALQIYAIETRRDAFTSQWLEETTIFRTPLSANAVLVDRWDGHMAIASAGLSNDKKPFLKVTTGELGRYWDEPKDYKDKLTAIVRPAVGTFEISEARVNGAAFVLRSGNLLMVYKERYKYNDQGPNSDAPQYYKAVISVMTHGENQLNIIKPLIATPDPSNGGQNLDPKNQANACQAFDARTKGPGQDVFNDNKDSIVRWQNSQKHQRHFVAYGDCGNVRIAEIFEENSILFSLPLPPGTPPVPLAAPGADPALVGAAAGALAGAMVLRMLAFKRKLAVEAPA